MPAYTVKQDVFPSPPHTKKLQAPSETIERHLAALNMSLGSQQMSISTGSATSDAANPLQADAVVTDNQGSHNASGAEHQTAHLGESVRVLTVRALHELEHAGETDPPTPPDCIRLPPQTSVYSDDISELNLPPGQSEFGLRGLEYPVEQPSDYHQHWTVLGNRPLGEGSYGIVTLASRKSTSRGYTPADKDKLYAVKQSKMYHAAVEGLHSLHQERIMHEIAMIGDSWKTQELFVFMDDYEKSVECPSWIAFPYTHGPTLFALGRELTFAPASLVLDVMEDMLDGLEWLHSANGFKPRMAHRDLHCSNIMFDLSRPVPAGRHPHIRILDLGLATYATATSSEEKGMALWQGQQDDINGFGHIMHSLAHNDWRGIGRAHFTLADQLSHCYSAPKHNSFCPHKVDPGTWFFRRHQDDYFDFIMNNCFATSASRVCKIACLTIKDIKTYLRLYIATARKQEMRRPDHQLQLWDTWHTMVGMTRPIPELPTEHKDRSTSAISLPPFTKTSAAGTPTVSEAEPAPTAAPQTRSVPTLAISELAEPEAEPALIAASEPHNVPTSGLLVSRSSSSGPTFSELVSRRRMRFSQYRQTQALGKRTQAQRDVAENPGIDEPLAKRLRFALANAS